MSCDGSQVVWFWACHSQNTHPSPPGADACSPASMGLSVRGVRLALSGNAHAWAYKYLFISPRGLTLQVFTVTV